MLAAGSTVDHNLFDGVGGNGVWLHAYNRKAMVSGNEMRNIGTQTRTFRSELCPCFLTESAVLSYGSGENGVGFTGETEWVDGTVRPQHPFSSG